ncbi:MAG: TonB-dependent receptor [Bacteroidota bacterium]|nr:TonB-dependent receptor [Bacteroidota bacterium]
MKFFKIILLSLFISNYVFAYSVETIPDTVYLEQIVVSTNRLVNFSTGSKVKAIEIEKLQEYSTKSLGKILFEQSLLDIKSYGSSGLSTISMRGAGSGHTAVLWNGFNLQDPMNGGVDLSLIPLSFIDNIQMQYGGSGALFGSGAIGGTIYLNNSSSFNNGFQTSIYQSIGSFSNYYSGVNFDYSAEKFVSSLRVFRKSAKNNFEFENYAQYGNPVVELDNAELFRYGLLQTNKIKIAKKQVIETRFWYQNSEKEIQPMMTNMAGSETQDDEFYRTNIKWQYKDNVKTYTASIAHFNNTNIYSNPAINQQTNNKANTTIGELESKYRIGNNHILNFGLNGVSESANSEFYGSRKKRDRLSMFSSYKFFSNSNNFATVISVREEIVNSKINPFTFSIGARAKVFNNFSLNANIAKSYRLPTFNELYWGTWGNPDLKAEKGFNEDFGIAYSRKNINSKISANICAFNSNISDWIIWLPVGNKWTPENKKEVWSRGIETEFRYMYKLNNIKISIKLAYNYTKTTNESDKDKQLIYVPLHKTNINLTFKYKSYSVNYNQRYSGKRYITENNSESISAYSIANFSIGKQLKLRNILLDINLSVNNVFSSDYQIVAWYAMPPRNYMINFVFKI